MSENKAEEIALAKLSVGSVSLAERMEAERKQREIEWAMRGIIDYRDNPHCLSTSMFPERPTPPPAPKAGSGFVEVGKLEPPEGIAQLDRIADYFAAKDKGR
jgi:hypothetical protein